MRQKVMECEPSSSHPMNTWDSPSGESNFLTLRPFLLQSRVKNTCRFWMHAAGLARCHSRMVSKGECGGRLSCHFLAYQVVMVTRAHTHTSIGSRNKPKRVNGEMIERGETRRESSMGINSRFSQTCEYFSLLLRPWHFAIVIASAVAYYYYR